VPRVLRSQKKYLGIRVTLRKEGERRVDKYIISFRTPEGRREMS
jgi:hypothetical protein